MDQTCQVLKTWQVSVVDRSQEICWIFAVTLKGAQGTSPEVFVTKILSEGN